MGKQELNPKIYEFLKKKLEGRIAESTIRPRISRIKASNPCLTPNAAAEIYARKHGTTIHRYLDRDDRVSYGTILREEIGSSKRTPSSRAIYVRKGKNIKTHHSVNRMNREVAKVERVEEKWDLFICHASEDKDEIVRPLKDALEKAGYGVWYDETEITLGDSLRRLIDEGLACSRYGLVILSPHFFEKHWTREELDGLTAREENGKKVILPVWHNVNKEMVAKYSPTLAGKYAAKTSKGIDSIVAEVKKVLKPSKTPREETVAEKSIKNKYEEMHDFIRSKEEKELSDLIRSSHIDKLQKQFEEVLDGMALFNSPNQKEDSKLFFFIENSILGRNEEDATVLAKILMDWYFGLNTPNCRGQILAMFVTFAKVRFLRKIMSENRVINLLVSDLGISRSYDSAALRAEILFNLRPVLSLQNIKDMLDYALANDQVGCSGNAEPYLMKIFTTTEGLDKEKVDKYKKNWNY